MRRNSGDNAPNYFSVLKLIYSSLRISVIPLSTYIWLTMTNHHPSYGNLKFSNFTGLKYMVCISNISGVYAFLVALSSWITCFVTKAWLFFVSDQIVACLMVTSWAAVMEILFLAYKGDKTVSWSEACTSYGKFCSRMKVALVLHALALCCFLGLAPPSGSDKEVEEERT
ncbi:CASP-like protein [Pyrus ussuriensis x Pyrus communis]|uniref:CASP-like protein n=1 Tax=Pyrus ussuriensis x Pyrus communis TaxID=2448454 RepID=A0A5N5FSI7_9ROSA|nr:CASP-like protein [Pyrus ussuriensis x Pyrus communis]